LGNTSSLPDGGDEQATAAQRPPGLGGGDEFGSIVGLVAQTLVVGEDPPQWRIVALALVDHHPDELRLVLTTSFHIDERILRDALARGTARKATAA